MELGISLRRSSPEVSLLFNYINIRGLYKLGINTDLVYSLY